MRNQANRKSIKGGVLINRLEREREKTDGRKKILGGWREKRGDFPGGISVGEVWVALFLTFLFLFFLLF
jgi:hypothetical protein